MNVLTGMESRWLIAATMMLIPFGSISDQLANPSDSWIPDEQSRCAVDPANKTESSFSSASFYPECVPPDVICGWKCREDRNCVEFNIKNDLQLCQLYYFRPTNFQQVDQCLHYQVIPHNILNKVTIPLQGNLLILFANKRLTKSYNQRCNVMAVISINYQVVSIVIITPSSLSSLYSTVLLSSSSSTSSQTTSLCRCRRHLHRRIHRHHHNRPRYHQHHHCHRQFVIA